MRPEGGSADSPGWTSRVVPNLYPALGEGEDAARPDSNPDLFASRPAVGAHEVLINAPEHATTMVELSEDRFLAAVATWRERMRAHAEAAYVQVVVNEGAGAGASLPHTHAQLYALPFVPAALARERERAGAYAERTAGGDLLGDVLVEEVRRRERLVAIDDEAALICPWASRSPYELRIVPRRAAARFEDDEGGAAMLRTAMRALAERFDGPPELNLWVATAPRGAESLLLACRHRPPPHGQGGAGAGNRRRHQCLPAGEGRGRPERVPVMPPNPRPIPRFIADSTQEGIPHGRFAERLAYEFRGACEEIEELPDGTTIPEEFEWFPERAWGGRVWVPATARAEGPEGALELFGHVSYVLPEEGEPSDFRTEADFTDVLAEDNPGWQIDLNDDVIGRWRGENGREGSVTLVWGRPLVRGAVAATAELELETVDQEVVSDERFTLIALDALKGYGDEVFMQVKLWSRRAQALATESLYA